MTHVPPSSFLSSKFAANHQEIEKARLKLAEKTSVKDKLSAMKTLVAVSIEESI